MGADGPETGTASRAKYWIVAFVAGFIAIFALLVVINALTDPAQVERAPAPLVVWAGFLVAAAASLLWAGRRLRQTRSTAPPVEPATRAPAPQAAARTEGPPEVISTARILDPHARSHLIMGIILATIAGFLALFGIIGLFTHGLGIASVLVIAAMVGYGAGVCFFVRSGRRPERERAARVLNHNGVLVVRRAKPTWFIIGGVIAGNIAAVSLGILMDAGYTLDIAARGAVALGLAFYAYLVVAWWLKSFTFDPHGFTLRVWGRVKAQVPYASVRSATARVRGDLSTEFRHYRLTIHTDAGRFVLREIFWHRWDQRAIALILQHKRVQVAVEKD